MGEIRTKEHPKNSKTKNVHFIKIVVSFPFLIPCLKTPSDERETSERRATKIRGDFFAKTCNIRRFARRKFAK